MKDPEQSPTLATPRKVEAAPQATHASDARSGAAAEPVAVVGLACRVPGAADADAFWRLLRDGVDAITEVPADRWEAGAFYSPVPGTPGKMVTRWGGFLNEIEQFDAQFFGISPREAARMDPQQRLLPEVVWEALENAGIPPRSLAQTQTGVFVGISNYDFTQIQFLYDEPARFLDAYSGTGIAHSIAANRISYLLNLRGPSMAVDTACSSALVATHLACQSLRAGETDVALCGGVNVILTPEVSVGFSLAGMLAPDGRCKTFDARADGYVRSEGCGVIVLKRLSDALRDGDSIVALLRGSAVNQDGRTNGLTAPNGQAQQAVMRRALAMSGVEPAQISYIEAQGTGTSIGDSIEVKAIQAVMGEPCETGQPCLVGAVKANVGHLESASGMVGLIKTLLCFKHDAIPPQLHFKELNPQVRLDGTRLVIPTELREWRAAGGPRFAGVNSFGFGGTNVHFVLEEAPAPTARGGTAERPLHLLTLTAKSKTALKEMARRYAAAAVQGDSLADICYSAKTGRDVFPCRLALTAENPEQLREKLCAFAERDEEESALRREVRRQKRPRLAMLFAGGRGASAETGGELYETQPIFRRAFDECAEILDGLLERRLTDFFLPARSFSTHAQARAFTDSAWFAFEYALASLWLAWGIEPDVVAGCDVGAYAAACIAGNFSPKEGLRLVRSRAGSARAAGAEDVWSASTPSATSRPESAGLAPDSFEEPNDDIEFRPLRLPLVSDVNGVALEWGSTPGAHYWRRHLDGGLGFDRCIAALAEQGCGAFLEIGSASTLIEMGRGSLPDADALWLASLQPGRSDWQTMLGSLGQLFIHGFDFDGAAFDSGYDRRRVPLPTYPFERKTHWLDPDPRKRVGASARRQTDGQPPQATRGPAAAGQSIRAVVLAAEVSERRPMLELFLKQRIARSLQLDPGQLDSETPLETIGLDSLMTMELKHGIESGLGVSLTLTELLDETTIARLAGMLMEMLAEHPGDQGHSSHSSNGSVWTGAVSDGEARRILARFDQLSDEEVSALLERMLS